MAEFVVSIMASPDINPSALFISIYIESTSSNAIAFSTGLIKTKDMLKVGIVIGGFGLVFAFFWLTKIFPFAA